MSAPALIDIQGLQKRFGDFTALEGIDLRVREGEFLVVLGASGAGKSTLLRCINRLCEPSAGRIEVAGEIASGNRAALRRLRCTVSMIFQHYNVVPRLSVLKNVLTGRLGRVPGLPSLFHVFPQADIDLAMDCLRRVELAHKAYLRTDSLSGGQKQRVGIARALAQQPRIILADEPVASLDPKTSRVVLQYLRQACRELGITVVCNLHQVDYAREFADRVVGMAAGRIVFEGRPDALDAAALARIYPGLEEGAAEEAEASSARRPAADPGWQLPTPVAMENS